MHIAINVYTFVAACRVQLRMSSNRQARYEQIADYIDGLISEGSPGDRLPTEAELCEQFGVSRMTARQAIAVIDSRGLITRKRGAGTFIRAPIVSRDLGSPLSFTGSMKLRGMVASSRAINWGPVEPSEDEADHLGLTVDDGAFVLERLRLADGLPMAIERVVMPASLAQLLEPGFEKGSLHDGFRQIGRNPSRADAEVTAKRASKRQRDLLELPQSGIVMNERRTISDQNGVPLERTVTSYAADRYSFRAILHIGQETA